MRSKQCSDHTKPLSKNLQWLPVEKRIEFEILLLTYKAKNSQSADYLKPLIEESSITNLNQGQVQVLKELKITTMVVEIFRLRSRNIKEEKTVDLLKTCWKLFILRKYF